MNKLGRLPLTSHTAASLPDHLVGQCEYCIWQSQASR